MPRAVGWEDETITGNYRKDDADKYRGVMGETHIIRVMTDCVEIRVHTVDDVLEKSKTGEERCFSTMCSADWDDDTEDWVGECQGCERDYEVQSKFVAGILHLATFKGRATKPQVIDPENAPMWWPFGGDKYRRLSDIVLEQQRLEHPKKLHQLELTVKCEEEQYQKLTISVSQMKPIMNKANGKAYLMAWKEQGPDLVAKHTKGPTAKEWKRILKPRRKRRSKDDAQAGPSDETPSRDETPPEEQLDDEDLNDLLKDL